jgi:dipeptidyl aminopeptidase/acylaminoacyl peptidase
VKHELERIEVPGEHDARVRTRRVVESAFAERHPVERASHWPRVAAIAVALAALVAAALSPPGRAVLDEVREVVGVERAQPALFSLPAPGRLLVASDAGVWVVQQDGSKRLLGDYREASWSPFGRFVVAARKNELAALEPDGDVRWTISRPSVRSPRWAGTATDTRIAYLSGRSLRLVAGDGSDDRLLQEGVAAVPPSWRPGSDLELAYADPQGRVVLVEADTGRILWRSNRDGQVVELEWSSDGRRLVARRADATDDVAVYTWKGALYTGFRVSRGTVTAAATRPGSHLRAVAIQTGGHFRLFLTGVPRTLLSGPGVLEDLTWSPDGRWLLVGWPTADQWVFVRADGKRIRAVSNVSEQFRSRSFPDTEGWCCAP